MEYSLIPSGSYSLVTGELRSSSSPAITATGNILKVRLIGVGVDSNQCAVRVNGQEIDLAFPSNGELYNVELNPRGLSSSLSITWVAGDTRVIVEVQGA